jgi:putative transposase
MSGQYTIRNKSGIYFCTLTVVNWIDVFTRKEYCFVVLDSLKYCQQHKGLVVHAYVIMSSHVHLLISAKEGYDLSGILRDLKQFTSKKIVALIQQIPESRKDWLLDKFAFAGKPLQRITNYKFWQDGSHAKECSSNEFLHQKLNYIHQNPVDAMIVNEPHYYVFSSAIDYSGGKGLLDVELVL